jgi:hypothetical protein
MSNQIKNIDDIRNFIFAGKAIFTIQSKATGGRFTYRLNHREDSPTFASVLTGPDNEGDYSYMGFIPTDKRESLIQGRKGMSSTAPSVVALAWFLRNLDNDSVDFFHAGKCGACGYKLTVPQSVARGLGPTCAARV